MLTTKSRSNLIWAWVVLQALRTVLICLHLSPVLAFWHVEQFFPCVRSDEISQIKVWGRLHELHVDFTMNESVVMLAGPDVFALSQHPCASKMIRSFLLRTKCSTPREFLRLDLRWVNCEMFHSTTVNFAGTLLPMLPRPLPNSLWKLLLLLLGANFRVTNALPLATVD